MPIYELICPKCGAKKEVICKFSELINNQVCNMCNYFMKVKPSRAGFHIEGYSYANSYSSTPDEVDTCYDGSSRAWTPD